MKVQPKKVKRDGKKERKKEAKKARRLAKTQENKLAAQAQAQARAQVRTTVAVPASAEAVKVVETPKPAATNPDSSRIPADSHQDNVTTLLASQARLYS